MALVVEAYDERILDLPAQWQETMCDGDRPIPLYTFVFPYHH